MATVYSWLLGLIALVPTSAQVTLTVSDDLYGGGTAYITVYDPANTGNEVEVSVDDGNVQNREFISVTLDSQGNGTGEWSVPTSWVGKNARFNYWPAPEETRYIWPD